MANSKQRSILALTCALSVMAAAPYEARQPLVPPSNLRIDNDRIAEVFRFAMRKSQAFEDLVATLAQQDRVVYVIEGRCPAEHGGCLQAMATPGGQHLVVRMDPRQVIHTVAVQLAHELYHASEIARYPHAVDDASIRELFQRIG